MKKILFASFLLSLFACRQQTSNVVPMCHDPKAEFAAFGDDQNFRDAHPTPVAFEGALKGEFIKFPVAGGKEGRAYFVKSKKKTDKNLLVFHEWWGLNDYVKNESDKWAKELKVNVLALDLYDGVVGVNPEEAAKLMQATDPKRAEAIISGAAQFAGPKADFRTIGWCFGGGWSLKAAILLKERVKKCVMFYGMPEKDVAALKTLATDVVFIHPTQDKWITAEMAAEFEKNMKAAGKQAYVYHYDADHAFANPSSPKYNEQAAKAARKVVKAYLRK